MLNDLDVEPESESELKNALLDNLIRDFSIPQRVSLTNEEEFCLLQGERFAHYHDGIRLACWHFGFGPEVVLVHGWNSRGANMWRFVTPLVSAGYSVTVFDAPAHGESKGSRTSPVHFADALRTLCGYLGNVHAVVGHSLGSAASLIAFRDGLQVNTSVHLAGPSSMSAVACKQLAAVNAPYETRRQYLEWIQDFTNQSVLDADLPSLTGGLRHPGLILHDRADRVVPFKASEALNGAWPQSTFVPVEGLGHRQLITDAQVISRCVAFIRAAGRATQT